jgi:hypothetical protein
MATYPAETATPQGVTPTPRAAANGDKIPGGSNIWLENANAAVCVVTVVTPKQVEGDLPVTDRAVGSAAANTGRKWIAIPNTDTYVDPADGLVTINFSVTASVTYYVLRDGL